MRTDVSKLSARRLSYIKERITHERRRGEVRRRMKAWLSRREDADDRGFDIHDRAHHCDVSWHCVEQCGVALCRLMVADVSKA